MPQYAQLSNNWCEPINHSCKLLVLQVPFSWRLLATSMFLVMMPHGTRPVISLTTLSQVGP